MKLYNVKCTVFYFQSWLFPWGPNIYLTTLTFLLGNLTHPNLTHWKRTLVTFLLNLLLTILISATSFTMYLIVQVKDLEIFLDSSLLQTTPILPSYQIHLQVLLAVSPKYILNLFTIKAKPSMISHLDYCNSTLTSPSVSIFAP